MISSDRFYEDKFIMCFLVICDPVEPGRNPGMNCNPKIYDPGWPGRLNSGMELVASTLAVDLTWHNVFNATLSESA